MPNPIFNALGGLQSGPQGDILQQFQQFVKTYKGNPKEEVMKLLQTGQISQQELNKMQAMATRIQNLMNTVKH